MRKNICTRLQCVLLSAAMTFSVLVGSISVSAAEQTLDREESYEMTFSNLTELPYAEYQKGYTLPAYTGEDLAFHVDTVLSWEGEERDAEVAIEVPADGLYEIWITYANDLELILPTELTLRVNGEILFSELRRLQFEQRWLPVQDIALDRYGNEIVTQPYAYDGFLEKGLEDSAYYRSEPFLFELTKGTHTLSFDMNDGRTHFSQIVLKAKTQTPDYVHHDTKGNALVSIEAERNSHQNAVSIHAGTEFNPDLSPYNASRRVLNFLDGSSFKTGGQSVTYSVTVPEDGWYNISSFYRQGSKTNFPVFANIAVNGQIPTKEAKNVMFPYTSSFDLHTIQTSEGENQSFYLTKGENEISVTLSLDPLAPVFQEIDKLFAEINGLTLQIMKLTGGVTTDRYRDYNLKENIPNLQETLVNWADRIDQAVEQMKPYAEKGRTSAFSSLTISSAQLRELAKEPEDLPRRMNELSSGPSSVSRYLAQQLQDMNGNHLSIDRIYLHQSEAELPERAGFFFKIIEAIRRFFMSFTAQDYSVHNTDEQSLQVWVARPRQYVELMQNMVDSQFTAQTGIKVDISLMPDQSKLVLANAAGESPDLALGVQYVLPSYLAIREALYDLKEFDNFQEVAKRFPEGLFIPSIVENGVYALPDTMNFWVMFYRTDIFETMGIPVPNSMEEVQSILPELQRRNMNFFFPTAGMLAMKVFPGTMPIIWQTGGSIFHEEIGRTALDSEISLKGFQRLTELFTLYNMPRDVQAPGFYQQFRDGTLPIGISDLATYNLLLNAAPEIKGLWSIALFPGFTDDNGEVLRHTTGGAESNIMFKSTDKPQEAWAFLDWWSSTEVQSEYGSRLQSSYGSEYLWNTANDVAFSQLPLRSEHKRVIAEQMRWMTEAAWVPGTYMVERELSNAYNAVVVDGVGHRRAMDGAVKRINRELFRKLEEFGYYKNGVMVRQYPTPDTSVLWED